MKLTRMSDWFTVSEGKEALSLNSSALTFPNVASIVWLTWALDPIHRALRRLDLVTDLNVISGPKLRSNITTCGFARAQGKEVNMSTI